MNNGSMLKTVWRIAIPYFRSEDKWRGLGLLALVIISELAIVWVTVRVNFWNNRFYNALQQRNWDNFVEEIINFSGLAALFIALAIAQIYVNQWLQIRWRAWLTLHYLGHWLDRGNHYRMQLTGDAADNPDQRISEDTKLFVERTLQIGIGLLSSVVTLASFVAILWVLSNEAPLTISGVEYNIPGYLVWTALIYAIIGTALTHWIGNPLVLLNFTQERYEADFRFNLVRVRENGEQIALLRGEGVEHKKLSERFGRVIENWYGIMTRTKNLTAFTASYSQASVIFPYIMVAPAYFASKIELGAMMQTASAFSSVQGALSFFVSVYRTMAEWRAVISRLDGFENSMRQAQAQQAASALKHAPTTSGDSIAIDKLSLTLPTGTPLVDANDLTIKRGQRVLVTGPSGSGKSTLFRAIAGIWPFGAGKVSIPHAANVMTLPQRPYFPIGSLKSAIAYPSGEDDFDDATIKQVVADVGLPALAPRLDEQGHWNRTLSLGEQQRLGVARALLHAPDYLFLDEATASLDEPSEEKLYRLIQTRLPNTAVISIGHRSTLNAFHNRNLVVAPSETSVSKFTLQEAGK